MGLKVIIEANAHRVDTVLFRMLLLQWGQENFRSFPWRLTRDPYKILLSEVMLHRTQAVQVVPVYENFVCQYPDLPAMAKVSKNDLHKALYSLGLRWRIDLIYQMVSELMSRFGGEVPSERTELLSLPGVSEYIAGAVRCFSWNLPEPLADTNTVRIVGRLFGLEIKDSSRRNRQFRELIAMLVDPGDPRAYNYALLDLADKVCMKKQQPDCSNCPLSQICCTGMSLTFAKS